MSRTISFRLFEMSEGDCQTILRSTEVLEKVVTTIRFAVSAGNVRTHCSVRSSAFITAASRAVLNREESL